MQSKKLFIPGPVDVSKDVLAKLSEPVIGHRGSDFKKLYESTSSKLKELMYTKNNVFLSTSSSTALMEAAVINCVKEKNFTTCRPNKIYRVRPVHPELEEIDFFTFLL